MGRRKGEDQHEKPQTQREPGTYPSSSVKCTEGCRQGRGEVLPALNLEALRAAQGGDGTDHRQQQWLVQRFHPHQLWGCDCSRGGQPALRRGAVPAPGPTACACAGRREHAGDRATGPGAPRRQRRSHGREGAAATFSSSGAESRGTVLAGAGAGTRVFSRT